MKRFYCVKFLVLVVLLGFSLIPVSRAEEGLSLNDYDELRTKTPEAIIEDSRKDLLTKYRDILTNYRFDTNRAGTGLFFLSEGGSECGGAVKRDEEFLWLDYSQGSDVGSAWSKITWRGCILGQGNALVARDTVLYSEEITVIGDKPRQASLSDFLGLETKSNSQNYRGKIFKIREGERSLLRDGETSFVYEIKEAERSLLRVRIEYDRQRKEERAYCFYRDVKFLETVKRYGENYAEIQFVVDPVYIDETDFSFEKNSRDNLLAVVKKGNADPVPLIFYHQNRSDRGYSYEEFLEFYNASLTELIIPSLIDRAFTKALNLLPFTDRVVEESGYQRLINELELWQIRIRSGQLKDLTDVEIGELIEAIKNGEVEIVDHRK